MSESETDLLLRASRWPEYSSIESLGPEILRRIVAEQGIDFATALLFHRYQTSSRHANFIRQIDKLREFSGKSSRVLQAKIVLVPGALYLERPDLGGDGRVVRETVRALGWAFDFIPIASSGSVLENARCIQDWIAKHTEEKIILISLSKGGKDLSAALNLMDTSRALRNVIAWINVCGPLDGSLMADWVLSSKLRTAFFRTQFWLQKRDFKFITGLRHDPGVMKQLSTRVPDNLKILHVVGFPLGRHFTSYFSRFCHRTLSVHGPNDGTILLSDLVAWPGKIYPVWGVDHYFRPAALAQKVISAILEYLAADDSLNISSQALETTGSA